MKRLRDRFGWCLLLLPALACQQPDDDSAADDDSAQAGDDDTTPPPDPIAEVIGLFNLTNVVQTEGQSWVDFSGAFGTFVLHPDDVFSPAAYLGLDYGAEAPYWRADLGAWPLPAPQEWSFVDLYAWMPWVASDLTWWDGGIRVGAGNYLTGRLDFDHVIAYQVDDPLSPGAAAWTAGGTLGWESQGGLDVVTWSAPGSIPLPGAVEMVEPAEGALVQVPSALDLVVRWEPGTDGAFVTIGLISPDLYAYVAQVPDDGEHTVPASVLHDDFGPGLVYLAVARNLQAVLEHPQGDIWVRTREERRATLELLPDLVIDPPFAQAGESLDVSLGWFTQDLAAGLAADFGPGVEVGSIVVDGADTHRATIPLVVDSLAAPGVRDVVLSLPDGTTETLVGGFAILDLATSDDCASADAAAPLAPGEYYSTTVGLADDYGSGLACLSWSLAGADAVYRVQLQPNETLVASLEEPAPGDGALYLLETCGDAASAVACADSGYAGDPEALVWTAEEAGTWYLVVDAWSSGGEGFGGSWRLSLQVEQQVLDPAWIVPDQTRFFVLSGQDAWDEGILPADIDLGAGVVADAAGIGDAPTDLEFLATAASAAAPGPRDVSVDSGPAGQVVFPEALWVSGWPPWDTCAEAAAADPVLPGDAVGFAVRATGTIDDVPCMPYASTGPEILLPLDLGAGQVLEAAVTLPVEDGQLYVLQDCALPESCFEGAAADATVAGEPEAIEGWEVPASGRYYLVVDVFGSLLDPLHPWEFDLSIAVW